MRCLIVSLVLWTSGCSLLGPWSPSRPLEQRVIFQPQKHPIGDWTPAAIDPEDAWFEAADGTRLHGWYVDHPNPRAVALVCHGNAGNISGFAETLQILRDRHGLAALVFDYRGYGRSAGRPSEPGILQDARAARLWLAKRAEVREQDILLMGVSLGGAVAIDLAQDGARGLVVASSFTSLPEVARHHFNWLPVSLIMTMRLDSLENITRYHGPLLISHGDADEVIPFRQGERLFEAAHGPKRFIQIPGGRHNDPQSETYRVALDEFIASLPEVTVAKGSGQFPQSAERGIDDPAG